MYKCKAGKDSIYASVEQRGVYFEMREERSNLEERLRKVSHQEALFGPHSSSPPFLSKKGKESISVETERERATGNKERQLRQQQLHRENELESENESQRAGEI